MTESECVGLKKHGKLVTSVAWSPCGRWLATSSRDETVNVYRFFVPKDGGQSTGMGGEFELVDTLRCSGTPDCIDLARADDSKVKSLPI